MTTPNEFIWLNSVIDTIINDKHAKGVDFYSMYGTLLISREYIYNNGKQVYYYNDNYDDFFLLYDFAANIGDTIIVHNDTFIPTKGFFNDDFPIPNGFKYIIDDIDSIEIFGQKLVRQKVRDVIDCGWGMVNDAYTNNGRSYIIENIGSLSFLMGVGDYIVLEEEPLMLRCYIDGENTYTNPLWQKPCDYGLAIENNKTDKLNLEIYPNPCNEYVYINCLSDNINIINIEIMSLHGKKLNSVVFSNNMPIQIDMSSLTSGCYFLHLLTSQGSYYKKIVVN
ncbi:MAG: T9SS type A sorting domain-containing protein [Bacteroidales bacterium]